MSSLGWTTSLAALAAGAGLLPCAGQAADPVAEFYKGKTISIYIGAEPGGSHDIYGRLASRYLGRHIPGEPTVVVRHMPGAGGLAMTNWLYNVAPQDGTALAISRHQVATEQALESKGVQWRAEKYAWIGRMAPIVELSYTWHTSPTKTFEDAQKRETIMGGSGPTAPSIWYLNVLNALAGTKFKAMSGYSGTNESHLAMERGELEGTTKSWAQMKTANADLLRDKKVNIILQYGLEKPPELQNVPRFSDLGVTPNDKKALGFIAMQNGIGRSVQGTPNIPADRLAALRKGLEAMMKDPELLAEAQKQDLDVGQWLSGEGLDKIIKDTLETPKDVLKLAKDARGD
jgi:tripartite-type tricarboxylate transporter receptor subunit TctC